MSKKVETSTQCPKCKKETLHLIWIELNTARNIVKIIVRCLTCDQEREEK